MKRGPTRPREECSNASGDGADDAGGGAGLSIEALQVTHREVYQHHGFAHKDRIDT